MGWYSLTATLIPCTRICWRMNIGSAWHTNSWLMEVHTFEWQHLYHVPTPSPIPRASKAEYLPAFTPPQPPGLLALLSLSQGVSPCQNFLTSTQQSLRSSITYPVYYWKAGRILRVGPRVLSLRDGIELSVWTTRLKKMHPRHSPFNPVQRFSKKSLLSVVDW